MGVAERVRSFCERHGQVRTVRHIARSVTPGGEVTETIAKAEIAMLSGRSRLVMSGSRQTLSGDNSINVVRELYCPVPLLDSEGAAMVPVAGDLLVEGTYVGDTPDADDAQQDLAYVDALEVMGAVCYYVLGVGSQGVSL